MTITGPAFEAMTASQLNDWYEKTVGYRPQVDKPTMTDLELRLLCNGYFTEAICRKWVAKLGLGFHPDTCGKDYSPEMTAAEISEYDTDMEALFMLAQDPYQCGIDAWAEAGLIPPTKPELTQ
jgi:hypothetical protein